MKLIAITLTYAAYSYSYLPDQLTQSPYTVLLIFFPCLLVFYFSARDKCEGVTCGPNATCDDTGKCACDQGFQGDGQRCDGRRDFKDISLDMDHCLKDPSQARLCYCFDLKFAIKLLVERDKTSQQFNW